MICTECSGLLVSKIYENDCGKQRYFSLVANDSRKRRAMPAFYLFALAAAQFK
jgi:hypothetical protein